MRARLLAPCLLLAACGGGAKGLGAKAHEEAAVREELNAAEEQRKYDPSLIVIVNECPFSSPMHDVPCWTADRNPTAVHLQEAERHRELAAAHRAKSQALREAEARACASLTTHDRDTSPFSHRADVASASPLVAPSERNENLPPRRVGASVQFRAVQGLTVDRLQRLVDCHLARNAAMGFPQAEEPDDPLDVPGATARVVAADDALRVEVRASDPAAARDVLDRALRLVPAP